MQTLDDFTKHYIIAALWSTTDNSDESGGSPLDENYSIEDIAPESIARIIEDCKDFQESNAELLAQAYELYNWHPDAPTPECSAGHDFWLTRNHHGAGFWDRGFPGELGQALTISAHSYGSYDLYVGDDGMIYGA